MQVIYPALDGKVRNVTLSYRVEHEDEERLFEQLVTLIATALAATGAPRGEAVRELVCKVEEVHTTLRKHLRKEEEQLLPLLLHHFTVDEQAQLIAQSLCCIPLATVGVVLSWVKATMTQDEQHTLLQQVFTNMYSSTWSLHRPHSFRFGMPWRTTKRCCSCSKRGCPSTAPRMTLLLTKMDTSDCHQPLPCSLIPSDSE